jgi:hypothetical protein
LSHITQSSYNTSYMPYYIKECFIPIISKCIHISLSIFGTNHVPRQTTTATYKYYTSTLALIDIYIAKSNMTSTDWYDIVNTQRVNLSSTIYIYIYIYIEYDQSKCLPKS